MCGVGAPIEIITGRPGLSCKLQSMLCVQYKENYTHANDVDDPSEEGGTYVIRPSDGNS